VEGDYLDAAMAAVGDVHAYLRGPLGLSDATLEAVRARLIAP